MNTENKEGKEAIRTDPHEREKILEQVCHGEYSENLPGENSVKKITVMFTALRDSTGRATPEKEMANRISIRRHNDILFPVIREHKGVLVKTTDGDTLSYFYNTREAVRAAIKAQVMFDRCNREQLPRPLLLVRIGLHTGEGVIEKNDIFGDVVTVAARIRSASHPGEIYLSEETYNELMDRTEAYIRQIKSVALKEEGECKLYKAFWDETEMASHTFEPKGREPAVKRRLPLYVKLLTMVSIPILITYLLMLGGVVPNPLTTTSSALKKEEQSLKHSITDTGENEKRIPEKQIKIIIDADE